MKTIDERYDTVALLRKAQKVRRAAIQSQIRIDNATRAFVRQFVGFTTMNEDESERAKQCAIAEKVVDCVENGNMDKLPEEFDMANLVTVEKFITSSAQARAPFDAIRSDTEKEMKKLVRTLPAWEEFGEKTPGFAELSLAQIVGECGDLDSYENPGKLWKRMGMAPYEKDGKSQAYSMWAKTGGLTSEEWIEAGYSPRRASICFNIAECLVKCTKSPYRRVYDQRKEYEVKRDPEIKPIRAHRRAMRYAVKRLLRDLWRKWTGRMEEYVGPDAVAV